MTIELSRLTYDQAVSSTSNGVLKIDIGISFTPLDGDLPPGVTGVFVKRAVIPEDPKADVFVRVAGLADLFKAATTRDIALNPGQYVPAARQYVTSSEGLSDGLYLSSELTRSYDSLGVAIKAKEVIEQRVDQLIRDWRAYRDSFADRKLVDLPLQDSAIVAQAKAAYYAAVDALAVANANLAAATTALRAANVAKDAAAAELAKKVDLHEALAPANAKLLVFQTVYSAYFSPTGKGRTGLLSGIASANVTLTGFDNYLAEARSFLTAARDVDGLGATVKNQIIDGLERLSHVSGAAVVTRLQTAVNEEGPPYLALTANGNPALNGAIITVDELTDAAEDDVTSARSAFAAAGTAVAVAVAGESRSEDERDAAADTRDEAQRYVLRVCPAFVPGD